MPMDSAYGHCGYVMDLSIDGMSFDVGNPANDNVTGPVHVFASCGGPGLPNLNDIVFHV